MTLRSMTQHSYYINVLTISCYYCGTLLGCVLHGVVSSTTYTLDVGPAVVLLVAASFYSWYKENHYDEHAGVLTTNSSIALLLSIVLLVVSEAALFISILWALVLVLAAHSVYARTNAGKDQA